MKPFRSPVLCAIFAAAWLAAGAPSPAAAGEVPPGVTPEQVEQGRQLLESGAPLPPEARKILESRPELKEKLLQEQKAKVEEERKGKDEAKPAAAVKAEPAPLPMYDWKASVYVRGLFLRRLTPDESATIVHFGHDLFAPRPGAVSVLENMPVAPNYVVGPGDEIVVKTWGRLEGTTRMTVDRDGKIFYPKIGSLHVAGKTFEELQGFLKSKVGTIAEVRADVSMGQLKAVRVSALGEVRAPGWYNVSSLHTALQALYLAGGVRDVGSLRRIEVQRGGKKAETIDLYDFVLKGDTRSDIRLLPGDTIFVPVVGRLVAVAGEVRRSAIYELNGEKTLLDAVRMAGGFAPSAYKKRVQVERLERNTSRIVLDTDAEELEKGQGTFELSDGDIVRVFPILRADENVVTLEGNVARPGRYELKSGMTVGSLLPDASVFLPETYFDYALLTRLVPPDLHREIIPVNLRAIVLEKRKESDLALRGQDTLKVFPRSAFKDRPKATISGEVRMARPDLSKPLAADNLARLDRNVLAGKIEKEARPDKDVLSFEIDAGARVSDLVKLAGGPTKTAALDRAELVRVDAGRTFRTIYFDLGKAIAGDPKEDVLLEDEDFVRIHSIYETRYKKVVHASGDVNGPGEYVLTDGMKLSDLLFKAGGFKESAYAREGELVRRTLAPGGELVRVQTLVIYPERALSGDASYDVPLKEYDLLVVRRTPDWAEKINVVLSGEVRFPGIYAAKKGERLSSLIARAGGFTPDAYIKAAQFTRESTRRSQQEAIDRLLEELEIEVAQKAQQVGGALDKEDIEANRELMAARRSVIAQLRQAKAKGRVIIRLAEADKLKGSSADILLEDADRLDIPRKTNVVNVVGRVYNPTGVVYDPANDALRYYLARVGGPTASADRDHIFLIKADGSVMTPESLGGGFFAGGRFQSVNVEPGDSIVVPEKLVQVRLMKDVKDITQILYQIAVTAGVLIVVF